MQIKLLIGYIHATHFALGNFFGRVLILHISYTACSPSFKTEREALFAVVVSLPALAFNLVEGESEYIGNCW